MIGQGPLEGLMLFTVFCLQFGAQAGVPIHGVQASTQFEELRGWVSPCPLGFDCPNIIYVNPRNADLSDRHFLRYLAAHEVCHLKHGDNRVWGLVGEKSRKEMHKRLVPCMQDLLGKNKFYLYKEWYNG